ncbi:hypothetical protein KEM55_000609, partial [Ascosphaera atra]
MPPAGISSSALTSNFDIFQGPAGTPSLGTMVAMDAFCLLIWGLFMWTWAQNFAIDLAQVQVAITLGGGSSDKSGGVNMLCVLVVLVLHLLRSQGIQDFVVGRLLAAKVVSADMIARIASLVPAEFRRRNEPQPPTWLRSLLAVHILAQAGTAMARRSMAKNRTSPASSTSNKGGKRVDTEASAGTSSAHHHNHHHHPDPSGLENGMDVSAPDRAAAAASSSTPSYFGPEGYGYGYGSHPSAPPAIKETRERMSSAKKRRRQANQVRSRQPFWAALASTKVTVMREYEHSRTGVWSAAHPHPVTEEDAEGGVLQDIWITSVHGSAICFAASDFPVSGGGGGDASV